LFARVTGAKISSQGQAWGHVLLDRIRRSRPAHRDCTIFFARFRRLCAGIVVALLVILSFGLQSACAQASAESESGGFAAIQRHPTIDNIRRFLHDHPFGKHTGEARRLLEQVEEKIAWQRATSANTREAYEAYLDLYPGGHFASEAAKRLRSLVAAPNRRMARPNAPAATTPLPAPPSERALSFIRRYHEAWSSRNADALAFMQRAYANRIDFYGSTISKSRLLAKKRAFAERWPERAYVLKRGTDNAVCNDTTCRVTAEIDWFAHSDTRRKSVRGTASFTLGWDFRRGVIVSESSKMLSRETGDFRPTLLAKWWGTENGRCRAGYGNRRSTSDACDRRDALAIRLLAQGWCNGGEEGSADQATWRLCDPRHE
jgi:hypothetical protein